jgi:hypothetical protein
MLPAIRPRFRALAAIVCIALMPSVALAAGSTTQRAVSGHAIETGNRCHRNAIDVPSCGVLWGLFKPPVPVPGQSRWSAHYPAAERVMGRRLDLAKQYVDWAPGDSFPTSQDRRLAHHHRTLYYSWDPVNYGTGQSVSYASIINGDWDRSVIRPEARHLKRFHHRVFLDFGHEFDLPADAKFGTPAQFAAAYRHIENVFRHMGVHNVIWSWVSTGYLGFKRTIRAGYPGTRYVDWIGYDPYNFAYCTGNEWQSTYRTFHPFYRWTSHQAGMRHKPLLASEYASAAGSRVARWYASIPSTLQRLPRLRALIQFSGTTVPPCSVQLSASRAALRGFAKAARSPRVIGTG